MSALILGLSLAVPASAAPPRAVAMSDVAWTPLNPARGDASPQAATLWGDRTAEGASGFLVRFVDGFASPPHIHNVSYRAVVLTGKVHNDDPGAAEMWMTPGSFWTQPHGEAHITSADGPSVVYVEIDQGPYLVAPAEQAVDPGEKPINIDASNLVWTASTVDGVQTAALWGRPDRAAGGTMLQLPAGGAVLARSTEPLRALVVQGELASGLTPGGLLEGPALDVTCSPASTCWLYVRGAAGLSLHPSP